MRWFGTVGVPLVHKLIQPEYEHSPIFEYMICTLDPPLCPLGVESDGGWGCGGRRLRASLYSLTSCCCCRRRIVVELERSLSSLHCCSFDQCPLGKLDALGW